MTYLFEAFVLVALFVFGVAAIKLMIFFILREAREYARARQVMGRITAAVRRDNTPY